MERGDRLQRISRAGLLATLLLGVGCGPMDGLESGSIEEEDSIDRRRQAIEGGELHDQYRFVVGLRIEPPGSGLAVCSGSLIAPNLVLTARHCLAKGGSKIACTQSEFGDTYTGSVVSVTPDSTILDPQTGQTDSESTFYQASKIDVPEASNRVCGFDIALVTLAEPIPASVASPTVPRLDQPVSSGEVVTAIGYGHIGNDAGLGTRRSRAGLAVECRGDSCPTTPHIVREQEFQTEGFACQGDSGGPVLDEKLRALGVASRTTSNGCNEAVYTGVEAWATWIRARAREAATAGGYPAPYWVDQTSTEPPRDDPDLDGYIDGEDNCPDVYNVQQIDTDEDGEGDWCDGDDDGDGVADEQDNCRLIENPEQENADGDRLGDACEDDDDGDGIPDEEDNCPTRSNPTQSDSDRDGIGNVCEERDTDSQDNNDDGDGDGGGDDGGGGDAFNPQAGGGGDSGGSCSTAPVGSGEAPGGAIAALAALLGTLGLRRRRRGEPG